MPSPGTPHNSQPAPTDRPLETRQRINEILDFGERLDVVDRLEALLDAALSAERTAREQERREWLACNAPGGWIDDLRRERDALRFVHAKSRDEQIRQAVEAERAACAAIARDYGREAHNLYADDAAEAGHQIAEAIEARGERPTREGETAHGQ
jgi:hypothetical protein